MIRTICKMKSSKTLHPLTVRIVAFAKIIIQYQILDTLLLLALRLLLVSHSNRELRVGR